ncbi:MAG: hypothetical protein ACRCTD_05520 [Beijerinckiaceae bacterium]
MPRRAHFLTGQFWPVLALVLACLAGDALTTAQAEVRFGRNVRIGGHDVSGQRFNAKRRGLYYIHNRQPSRPGCRWVVNRDGGRTKICHLKRR